MERLVMDASDTRWMIRMINSEWITSQQKAERMLTRKGWKIPACVLEEAMGNESILVRKAAMELCRGQDVPYSLLRKGLADKHCYAETIVYAMSGRILPVEVIGLWLDDPSWRVREIAMYGCIGQSVPDMFLLRGLADENRHVRKAAKKASCGRRLHRRRDCYETSLANR